MATTSKFYQSTWTYDPSSDDFNAKVGKILSSGVDLGASYKSVALASCKDPSDVLHELTGQLDKKKEKPAESTSRLGSRGTIPQGFALVDQYGNVLPSQEREGKETQVQQSTALTNNVQSYYTSLAPPQRSMRIWHRLNAGCVEATTKVPSTTMKEHYSWDEKIQEPLDFTYHRKKTDFSDYTEVKLKVMHHIDQK